MFKTPYKTIYRIQTVDEALEFDLQTDETDMYLYLIDMYDVLLNAALGGEEIPEKKTNSAKKEGPYLPYETFSSVVHPYTGQTVWVVP